MEVRRRHLKQYRGRAAFRMDFEALGARFRVNIEPPGVVFFKSLIEFGETSVKPLRLKNLI